MAVTGATLIDLDTREQLYPQLVATPTRAERKEQTRQALLDGAVTLAAGQGFSAVSLREIAKSAGIVPTAFYRHFSSLDELGATLADDGIRSLRLALREIRRDSGAASIKSFVTTVFAHVQQNSELLGFLVREHRGGPPQLRSAINSELRLLAREFATDLSRLPELDAWDIDDLEMATELLVSTVAMQVGAFVTAGPRGEAAVVARTEQQLRIIALGMGQWHPKQQ
jgi:AcrR family transcriptional regulator